MLTKAAQRFRYLLYALITNIIYGFILYYVCTWLAGYSLLYAYLGNLALIVMGLAMDEYTLKIYRSKKLVEQIKNEKDKEMNYRLVLWAMESFVSFKTVLYVFYILIMILAQVADFYPALMSGSLGNFILTTQYSIVLLVAFDMLAGQFSKDRKRMKKISTEFVERFAENQE